MNIEEAASVFLFMLDNHNALMKDAADAGLKTYPLSFSIEQQTFVIQLLARFSEERITPMLQLMKEIH